MAACALKVMVTLIGGILLFKGENMTIGMAINGSLELDITDLQGNPISEEEEKEVLQRVKSHDYAVALASKQILDINDATFRAVYLINFRVGDDTECSFPEDLNEGGL